MVYLLSARARPPLIMTAESRVTPLSRTESMALCRPPTSSPCCCGNMQAVELRLQLVALEALGMFCMGLAVSSKPKLCCSSQLRFWWKMTLRALLAYPPREEDHHLWRHTSKELLGRYRPCMTTWSTIVLASRLGPLSTIPKKQGDKDCTLRSMESKMRIPNCGVGVPSLLHIWSWMGPDLVAIIPPSPSPESSVIRYHSLRSVYPLISFAPCFFATYKDKHRGSSREPW